jgi:hypothetical protein
MALNDILSLIDTEIATLNKARTLLAAGSAVTGAPRKAGRPPEILPDSPKVPKLKKKRNLTPESRARIVEAVRRRWAAHRKAAK